MGKKKVYFKRLREDVRKEFTKARKDIEKKKMDQFEGALSHAVMNDTVAALLAGKDPPADASDDCIKEASRRVKKIKAKAERLKMDVNDATKQKGKKKTNISRQQESDSEVDESSGDDQQRAELLPDDQRNEASTAPTAPLSVPPALRGALQLLRNFLPTATTSGTAEGESLEGGLKVKQVSTTMGNLSDAEKERGAAIIRRVADRLLYKLDDRLSSLQ